MYASIAVIKDVSISGRAHNFATFHVIQDLGLPLVCSITNKDYTSCKLLLKEELSTLQL